MLNFFRDLHQESEQILTTRKLFFSVVDEKVAYNQQGNKLVLTDVDAKSKNVLVMGTVAAPETYFFKNRQQSQ